MIAPKGANASLILPIGPLEPAVATDSITRCGTSRSTSHSWAVKSAFVAMSVLLVTKCRSSREHSRVTQGSSKQRECWRVDVEHRSQRLVRGDFRAHP